LLLPNLTVAALTPGAIELKMNAVDGSVLCKVLVESSLNLLEGVVGDKLHLVHTSFLGRKGTRI